MIVNELATPYEVTPLSNEAISSWGRIVFTEPRRAVGVDPTSRGHPTERRTAAGHNFGLDFDEHLQTMYARSIQQARDLVDYLDPKAGEVAIEVGAGAGRIAFDGGLAERLGPGGQLLLTDISGVRLDTCIERAREIRAKWVRVLRAPAERIPVVDDSADLVLAVSVLHFTDQDRAIAELARIAKPGGRIVISTGLDFVWTPPWWAALSPVRAALARHRMEYRPYLPTGDELLGRLGQAGLQVDRYRTFPEETLDFPNVDLAIGFWRQIGLVPLILRAIPVEEHELAQDEFDQRVRVMFATTAPEERRLHLSLMDVIARKP